VTDLRSLLQTVEITTGSTVDVLRLDRLHPLTGGNKIFKLKYNLLEAGASTHGTLLTFGGPFSNHIAATAHACREAEIKAIGVIRGARIGSETLAAAENAGMKLLFVSREEYGRRGDPRWLEELEEREGPFVVVPEGGANKNGLRGCMEILPRLPEYDYVFCASGTGTTFAGLLASKPPGTTVVGISVLKGENLQSTHVQHVLLEGSVEVGGDEVLNEPYIMRDAIMSAYSFSGYAKFDEPVVGFKTRFEKTTGIPLDHIYTAKLFFGVSDLMSRGKLRPGCRVLVIHSGGLQGNAAFESRYQRKLTL
jgi:1-aminocyclopropane-1-carboxylate deaminase